MRRYLPLFTMAVAIVALYLYHLNGIGVIPPDEPRYAAIGRTMAQSGDWITPKLWGSTWFEKPPLLYWMTALGTNAGLGPELSGRLPVALLSLAFLVVVFFLLRREFGREAACVSIVLLATSAGWLTYSELCLTDLPMSVFFSLAVFLALPLVRGEVSSADVRRRFALIGVCLGLGALAKGLVPIALAVPFLWFLRHFWKMWWIAAATCVAVAGPWYGAVYYRNGVSFIEEFFLRHHLERLYSASLQHVQPWWYYFPILLAGLFPWTPLLVLLIEKRILQDRRRLFLAVIALFGFALFSVALNKLPGYLLPLFPSIFVLIGGQFETKPLLQLRRAWLVCCACLTALIPFIAIILPRALAVGRISWPLITAAFKNVTRMEIFYVALPLVVVILARRSWIPYLLVLSLIGNALYLKVKSYPVLNETVSARRLWLEVKPVAKQMCEERVSRDWLYGLQFYAGFVIPPCNGDHKFTYVLEANGHKPPTVQHINQ